MKQMSATLVWTLALVWTPTDPDWAQAIWHIVHKRLSPAYAINADSRVLQPGLHDEGQLYEVVCCMAIFQKRHAEST